MKFLCNLRVYVYVRMQAWYDTFDREEQELGYSAVYFEKARRLTKKERKEMLALRWKLTTVVPICMCPYRQLPNILRGGLGMT